MSRVLLRQEAIRLRTEGKTYSEIRQALQVPKSTLSEWLSSLPLTELQIQRLERTRKLNKFLSIEKVRQTKLNKRTQRLAETYKKETSRLLPLTQKQLEIAGLFLYWGEGSKSMKGSVSINNTDPQVMKFVLYWLVKIMGAEKNRIRVYLHLYSDMDINQSKDYWKSELGIPLSQFANPYIKNSKRAEVDQKGFGHGTCTLVINDIRLKEKIMMGIKSIADYYGKSVGRYDII